MPELNIPREILDEYYKKISNHQGVFRSEVKKYSYSQKVVYALIVCSFLMVFVSASLFPTNTVMTDRVTFEHNPLLFSFFWVGFGIYLLSMPCALYLQYTKKKLSKTIGPDKEESLYLSAFYIFLNLEQCINENNYDRKRWFSKKIVKSAKELTDKLKTWKVGNVKLIPETTVKEVEQLKANLTNKVLPNLANVDDSIYYSTCTIMDFFCRYLYRPTVEDLTSLNRLIHEANLISRNSLTGQQRLTNYLYTNPRGFRLFFASIISTLVGGIVLYVSQNWVSGLTVGVASFGVPLQHSINYSCFPLLNEQCFACAARSLRSYRTSRKSQTKRQNNEKQHLKLSLINKKGNREQLIKRSPLTIHRLLKRQSRRNLNVWNQRKVRVTLLHIKNSLGSFTNLFVVTSSNRHIC